MYLSALLEIGVSNSGYRNIFVLRTKEIDGAFQLSLLQTKNNEMHIVDDFCKPCKKEQFRLILKGMVLALVENKGNYAKHVLPLVDFFLTQIT